MLGDTVVGFLVLLSKQFVDRSIRHALVAFVIIEFSPEIFGRGMVVALSDPLH